MANHLWNTHPKSSCKGVRRCRVCGNGRGIIRKYELNMCRRCFREQGPQIGFQQLR